MKIEIQENATYGRIEEILEGQEITSCFICNRDPQKQFESHHGMHYCCQAHQELHLSEGGEPLPFRVLYRPEIGRYMVAARDIQPGEVIFTEEPLALG